MCAATVQHNTAGRITDRVWEMHCFGITRSGLTAVIRTELIPGPAIIPAVYREVQMWVATDLKEVFRAAGLGVAVIR